MQGSTTCKSAQIDSVAGRSQRILVKSAIRFSASSAYYLGNAKAVAIFG